VNPVCSVGVVLFCLMAVVPVGAATRVTIAQLQQFLASKQATKESDEDIADRLSAVALSQELAGQVLTRILAEESSRPKTAEQIELMAAESVFNAPPLEEWPQEPAPDKATQQRMIDAARTYVTGTLHALPDFLAIRVTRRFDNRLADFKPKHGKPRAQMRPAGENRREIAYRNGHEVEPAATGSGSAAGAGLSTWGEFGGILKVVLNDAFNGLVAWERWQRNEAGAVVAVFRYEIPEASSHYSVDFCCYRVLREIPMELPFNAKPGYHGELFVDPRDGSIDRITVEADLKESDPVVTSAMAVQYGHVAIGGRQFICPVRAVAVTEVHNLEMEAIDAVGMEKHVNLVEFRNYRKFGSTVRIRPD